jgi:hypothetical protein
LRDWRNHWQCRAVRLKMPPEAAFSGEPPCTAPLARFGNISATDQSRCCKTCCEG